MKKQSLILVGLLIAAIALLLWVRAFILRQGAGAQSDTIVKIHFAGIDTISSDTNSLAFTNEFCSAEARTLENQTLDKMSRAPGAWFKDKLPTGASDGSSLLRPLLDDFLKSEWLFQMRDVPGSPEYALAIRLNADRASLWQTNFRSLLESWTGIKAKDISGGWELKKDEPPNLFRIVRTGDWVVIGCGENELPLSDAWSVAGKIPKIDASWLSLELDWPRLAQIFPALARFDFPRINLQTTAQDGNFQLNGKIELAQPLPALDQWQIPTNTIHEPLTSFTAIRGFVPWLEAQSRAKPLELTPEPGQLFIWSLEQSALQTFIAVPVPNATNALAQLGQNLSADGSWENNLALPFDMNISSNRIWWSTLPLLTPGVDAVEEPSGDYLVAGAFYNPPRGRKGGLPKVFSALDQDNLVYYHWEITSNRLDELPQLTQFALLLTKHRQLDPDAAAYKWLFSFGSTLGNSVTAATQTGPSELTFTRTAPGGLTAIELIALAEWLEAPNFPGCDLSLPPRPPGLHHRPQKQLSAPAPVPPLPLP